MDKKQQEEKRKLIQELKDLKSGIGGQEDLQIVFTDVKEGPTMFNILPDKNSSKYKYIQPTVRLLRYGQVFNERTGYVTFLKNLDHD